MVSNFCSFFGRSDRDGSGTIDRNEFRTGVQYLNKRLPKGKQIKDADGLFDILDVDGNGRVDINEFNSMFQSI